MQVLGVELDVLADKSGDEEERMIVVRLQSQVGVDVLVLNALRRVNEVLRQQLFQELVLGALVDDNMELRALVVLHQLSGVVVLSSRSGQSCLTVIS